MRDRVALRKATFILTIFRLKLLYSTAIENPLQFYQPTILDVGWVEQRGTQQLQALRWVTLRCTQPTILPTHNFRCRLGGTTWNPTTSGSSLVTLRCTQPTILPTHNFRCRLGGTTWNPTTSGSSLGYASLHPTYNFRRVDPLQWVYSLMKIS
jgi:hypothetical protein